ncbi:hypothetical protein PVL29_015798 [Vitis rotundifolia]|uniref:Ribulose bisphosphate carboxylase large subunit C-terminal domain-containing protein n=1 Tax=Vitis rotundifolia TaxID=103349 RepID=A0AA39DJF3_VITRO|nr:hypothetical protein PVL29_015798 [Vitis rotundifolia]
MKQKVVIKVAMNGQKSRVESAALKGQEKEEIEVTGEEIDAKKEQKKEEKKEEQKNEPTVHAWHSYPYEIGVTHYPIYHCPDSGGIHVWHMPALTEIFGDDSVLQFGGGIHRLPGLMPHHVKK